MNKIIQCLPRLLAFLLAGCVFSASAYTLVVGNDVEGKGRDKYQSTGPTADFTLNHSNVFGKTVAVHKETGLREVAVYDWTGVISPGMVYCYKNDPNYHPIRLFHNYISSGLVVDNHTLWKTSINGLYFVIELTTLGSAGVSTDQLPIWIDKPSNSGFDTRLVYSTTTGGGCSYNDTYYRLGGLNIGFKIHLYADQNFAPTAQQAANFQLSKNGGHGAVDFYFHNSETYDQSHSKKINFTIPATGMILAWPTCSASTIAGVSGTSVTNGNDVQLGNHLPKNIKDGLSPAKFNINMAGCSYIHNIEVKLASTKIGTNNKQLLGNLETSGAASGVGVLIEGLQSSASAQMVIVPNSVNSVYKDIMNDPYTQSEIGVDNKTLSFQATLKQDGSADIKPGKFRGTGTFQITYP
ncbi:fimbrial protein [Escherichia whittamii]|uniref:fimbrial protein n=1 Tax=Escherichia whittamii TaxID=2762229 RepID=UPI002DBE9E95|nr:fimbrial protein [Escherichia whittamii]EEZ4382148.1 fimbrial protein [Escherichia coli]MEB7936827.1 fimbrial protein [Escherichia whittamii]